MNDPRTLRRAIACSIVALTTILPTASAWIAEPPAPPQAAEMADAPFDAVLQAAAATVTVTLDRFDATNVSYVALPNDTAPPALVVRTNGTTIGHAVVVTRLQPDGAEEGASAWTYTLTPADLATGSEGERIRWTIVPGPHAPLEAGEPSLRVLTYTNATAAP